MGGSEVSNVNLKIIIIIIISSSRSTIGDQTRDRGYYHKELVLNTMVCTTVAVAKVGESTTPPPTVLALKPTATTATSSLSSDTPIQICRIQPKSNQKKVGFSNGGISYCTSASVCARTTSSSLKRKRPLFLLMNPAVVMEHYGVIDCNQYLKLQ